MNTDFLQKRLLVILFIALWEAALSQPRLERHFSYNYYSTYDGLSQSQVTNLYQCSRGYLWVCTKDGVSRFDGNAFKNFKSEGKNKVFNHVSRIFENHGNYYFLSSKEITSYNDVNLHTLESYQFPEGFTSPMFDCGRSFMDSDLLYLINCSTKIPHKFKHLIFDLSTNLYDSLQLQTSLILLFVKNDNSFYALTNSYCYIIKNKKVHNKIQFRNKYNCFFKNELNQIIGFSRDEHNQLFRLTISCDSVLENVYSKKQLPVITSQTNSLFYQQSNKQIYYQDLNRILYSTNLVDEKKLVGLDIITAKIQDTDNNLWIGTEDGIYNLHSQLFEEYEFNVGNKVDNAWTILQDNSGTMWFGGYESGVWTLNSNDEINTVVPEEIGLNERACWNFSKQYMGGCRDPKGNLFFPYSGHLMVKSNNHIFTICPSTPLFLFNDEKNNRILSWGTDNYQISKIYWNPIPIHGEAHTIISCVETKDGNYLLGSFHGQYIYNNEAIVALPDTFAYKGVVSMASDSLFNIWKGTTNGLYLSTPSGEQQIAPKQIGNQSIGSVYRYENLLFAGAGRSLYLLDIAQFYRNGDQRMKVFNQYNGFVAMDDAQNGFFLDRDSFLWYPAVDKVIRFKPEELAATLFPKIPTPNIVSVLAGNKEQQSQVFYNEDSTIQLNRTFNALRFEFFASAFSQPDKVVYRHRLNGFNDNWTEPSVEPFANYTNLGHGTYQMQVQSSIDGENWSKITASPTIDIAPYWWHLVWVRVIGVILFILLLATIIVLIVKARQRKIIRKLNEQKRLNELRLQSVRSKHIPHFSGNALANIEHFIFSSDLRQANKFLSKYSKLMNITLRDAEKASRSIELEIEYVTLYLELEKMRFQDKIDYMFDIDPMVDKKVQIPNMLLHTWVENAVKHGIRHLEGTGKISLLISQNKINLHIIVEDNGVGRTKAHELGTHGSGTGLSILKEQLEIYNHFNDSKAEMIVTDLITNDKKSIGTRFELVLPKGYRFES